MHGETYNSRTYRFNSIKNTHRLDTIKYPGYEQFLNGLSHVKAMGDIIANRVAKRNDIVIVTDPLSCNIRMLRYLMNLQNLYLTFIAYWDDIDVLIRDSYWENEVLEISKLYESNWCVRNSIIEPMQVKFNNGQVFDRILMPNYTHEYDPLIEKTDTILLLEEPNSDILNLLAMEYPNWQFKKMYGQRSLNKGILLKEFERAKVVISLNPNKSDLHFYNYYEAMRRGCYPLIPQTPMTEKLFPRKYLIDFEKLKLLKFADTKMLWTLRKRTRVYPIIKKAMEMDPQTIVRDSKKIENCFFDTKNFVHCLKNKNGRKLIVGGKVSPERSR